MLVKKSVNSIKKFIKLKLKEYYDSPDVEKMSNDDIVNITKNTSIKDGGAKNNELSLLYADSQQENTLNLGNTLNFIITKYSPLLKYYKYTFHKNETHKFIELNYELINKKHENLSFKSHINVVFFYKDMKRSGEFVISSYFDIQKLVDFNSPGYKFNNPDYESSEIDDKNNIDFKSDKDDEEFFNEISIHEKVKNFDIKKFESILKNDINKCIIEFEEYCKNKYNILPLD